MVYRTCAGEAAGVAKGSILPQHGWACAIHRSKAGRGYPRQQLGQDSLFVALPAVSCRIWSPAQTAAAQVVLPPTCSLRVVTGGLAKVPVSFLPRYPEGMKETDWVCKARALSKPWRSIIGGERGNRKDKENFWLLIHSAHKGKDEHHLPVDFLARHWSSPLATSLHLSPHVCKHL